MQPMLDPKRDLAGATPETLARALLRPTRPGATRPPVVRDHECASMATTSCSMNSEAPPGATERRRPGSD